MSENLKLLNEMFPGKLLLTPEEVGQAVGWDRKTIYRLKAADRLPFPVRPYGNLFGIPKVALAAWLDGGSQDPDTQTATPGPAEETQTPRKRGRPRKALSVRAFQGMLAAAWEYSVLTEAIGKALDSLGEGGEDSPSREASDRLRNAVGAVAAEREAMELEAEFT